MIWFIFLCVGVLLATPSAVADDGLPESKMPSELVPPPHQGNVNRSVRSSFAGAMLPDESANKAGSKPSPMDGWTYEGEFHKSISAADRIVIRDGGFNYGEPFDGQRVLFEVSDPLEIKGVYGHIKFKSPQILGACLCCGHPGIDWYRGQKRVASTSVQHGLALRWDGFPGPVNKYGDAQLTDDSAEWLVTWLAKHGVGGPKEEWEAKKRRELIRREADQVFAKILPVGFQEALLRAKVQAESRESAKEEPMDKCIRAAFSDTQTMYATLFRLMGCLPMRWDSRYVPDQDETYEFLTRAPREELDQAFEAAATSKDTAEKRGAARVVFTELDMSLYGKGDGDIARWMGKLADAAYADPFPENRRLVLSRLIEEPNSPALDVVELAAGDPDQTVRRRAIKVLALRGGTESTQLLQRIASGEIRPRMAAHLPKDYGTGTGISFATPEMAAETYPDTEREGAEAAIRAIRVRPTSAGR